MHDHLSVLVGTYLPQLSVGKVRNAYQLKPRRGKKLRLMLVSNRVSIFDFKLGFEVEGKGEALNAFAVAAKLYRRKNLKESYDDLVAWGAAIDRYLPEALRGNKELQRRATVVFELDMINVEAVVRGYAEGSLWKAAHKGQKSYCGHLLQSGLCRGQKLTGPFFTPTTKARHGHDSPLNYRAVREQYGQEFEDTVLRDFNLLSRYSYRQGIIGVDSKGEYGYRFLQNGRRVLALGDEFWTPDSARFWEAAEYQRSYPRKLPPPMDKQALRNWGKTRGIDRLDPKDPQEVERVKRLKAPQRVVDTYRQQVERAFEMLWGKSLKEFQRNDMGIS